MKFISKYKKLTYWIEPSYYSRDAMGKRAFVAGKFAQFDNGYFSTNDQEIINAMLESPECGRDFAPVQITEETLPVPELEKKDNYAWARQKTKVAKTEEPEKEEAVGTESREFVCEECGKLCKSKLGLMAHMRSHR